MPWKDQAFKGSIPGGQTGECSLYPGGRQRNTKCVGGKDQMVDSNPFRTKGAAQEDPEEKSNDP